MGQTNGVYIKGSNDKINASNDISSETSDAFVIWGQSAFVICDGATIRKAGRYAFNIYDSSKSIKIINNNILSMVGSIVFNVDTAATKNITIKDNYLDSATNVTNVLKSTAVVDRLYFTGNIYPASIATPINSLATNSVTTGNYTY
jgi:hypothetical protein